MNRNSLLSFLLTLIFLYLFLFDFSPRLWLGGELSAGQAFFASRLEWGAIGEQIRRMKPLWLAAAAGWLLAAMVVRSFRWRSILWPMDRLGLGTVFGLNNLGYMANNLLPMRLGEILRSAVLAQKSRLDFPAALGTVVVERILDLLGALGLLFLLLVALPREVLGEQAETLSGLLPLLAALTGAGLILLILLVLFRDRIQGWIGRLALILPARFADRVTKLTESFTAGLTLLDSLPRILLVLGQTLLLYACYFLSLKCILLAMGLDGTATALLAQYPFGSTLLVMVFVTVGYMIPAAPGAIGTVQYFTALGLELLGVPASPAGGFALVNHFLTYIILTGLGVIALGTLRIRFGDLLKWQHGEASETRDDASA